MPAEIDERISRNLRILFIAPGNLAGDFSNVPNGIGILAAIAKRFGVFVKVIDYSIEPFDRDNLKRIIEDERINVVGLTMMTCQALVAYDIARYIRTIAPGIKIISGGIHPSLMPEESLENSIDVVFRDEAEESFRAALPALSENNLDKDKISKIKGLAFKSNGVIVLTPPADRITNLDSLPLPAYELFKFPEKYTTQFLYKKGFSTNLITSRGCIGSCIFCCKHYQGVYFQSAERVVEQFIFLKERYNISQIFVQDDLFTHDIDRVHRICDLLIREKVDIPWVCSNTRVDAVRPELFEKMKKSGCISVAFGIESGNARVRRKIGKPIRTRDIINVVTSAKQAGLLTGAFYIFGHHCETYDDAMDTIRFAKKLNTDTVCFSINCPYPGTPLFRLLEMKGVKLTRDWGAYRTWGGPLFETEHLKKEDIVNLQKKAYRQYFFRLRYIAQQLKNLFTTGNFFMYWRGGTWLLEQYFGYTVLAAAKPEHIKKQDRSPPAKLAGT